jgi:mercuric ion transport protein
MAARQGRLSFAGMAAATPKVELVYDPDCPNVDRARERLRQAIGERGEGLPWTEWRSDDPTLPDYARGHGSPTILIDERDVAAAHPAGRSCRLYDQGNGTLHPAPPVAAIIAALRTRSV